MFYFWNILSRNKAYINKKTHKHKTRIGKKVAETYLQKKMYSNLSYNDNYNFLNFYSFRFVFRQNH